MYIYLFITSFISLRRFYGYRLTCLLQHTECGICDIYMYISLYTYIYDQICTVSVLLSHALTFLDSHRYIPVLYRYIISMYLFSNLVLNSYRISIVFTLFWLIWHQMEFYLVSNQSENVITIQIRFDFTRFRIDYWLYSLVFSKVFL